MWFSTTHILVVSTEHLAQFAEITKLPLAMEAPHQNPLGYTTEIYWIALECEART